MSAILGGRVFPAGAILGADLVYSDSAFQIVADTADAADNKSILVTGGGAGEAIGTTNRGAKLLLHGNEHGTAPGEAYLEASGVVRLRSATGAVQVRGASAVVAAADGSARWTFASDGDLESDGTNGGNLVVGAAGKGLHIKSGSNARIGTATLVAGTVTVANTSVTANTRILLSRSTTGGTAGHLSTTRINNTSFTINSSSGTDTSTIEWVLVESF